MEGVTPQAARHAAATVLYHLNDWLMPVRRDWNRRGPYVPRWFRRHLKRIDPLLTLQFIPPARTQGDGINPARHPQGVWAICRRLRRTKFLFKRWTFSLSDRYGRLTIPTMDMIHVIAKAHRLWRQGQAHQVEEQFDRTMDSLRKTRSQEARDRLLCQMEDGMRRYGFTSARPRVFCPSPT